MNQANIVQGNLVNSQNYIDEETIQNLIVNGSQNIPTIPNNMGNIVVIGTDPNVDNMVTESHNGANGELMNSNGVNGELMNSNGANGANGALMNANGANGELMNANANANNNMTNQKKLTTSTLNLTFYITYAFLMTTATITFIEAIRTKDIKIRNILNLETCISIVATFFYTQFVEKIKAAPDGVVDYKVLNMTRYTDWMITTPIMLLVLVLAINYNTGGSLKIGSFVLILIFNALMLGCGYFGERGRIEKKKANMMGFVFFAVLFGYIYMTFMHGKYSFDNNMIFWAFVILWAIYGIIYQKEEEDEKNAVYNVLDLLSKCFVGIFFWAYFTKVFIL
jgi:bacteriorhodopsin